MGSVQLSNPGQDLESQPSTSAQSQNTTSVSNSGQDLESQPSTSAQPQNTTSASGSRTNFMNINLFKAVKKGSTIAFDDALSLFSQPQIPTIINQTSPLQNTVLHLAAIYGHHELALHLVRKFPDLISRENHKGDTPLHVAARAGHLRIVQIIVQNERPRNDSSSLAVHVNEEMNTPLHEAMIHNREKVVDYFLEKNDCNKAAFCLNKDGKSPLYLAVESGSLKNFRIMLSNLPIIDQGVLHTQIESGKSLIHAAITGKNEALLREIAEAQPLFNSKDKPLHYAASTGFLNGVNYLLSMDAFEIAFEIDDDGYCPIHLASKNGHVKVIKKLLSHYPDASEFLSRKDHNILHVAAENGKNNVVKYILKNEGAELLLNERDENGNTPLHLATKNWHANVVSSLIWDKRTDLKLVNDEGLTALEVAEKYYMEEMAPFRERLTWMVLMSAGTPRAKVQDTATVRKLQAAKYEPYNMEYCKDRVNTLLLVAALVATVTFAAGFTMPGGNKSSNSDEGMATMIHKQRFQVFVICDSLAMYSSIIVTVTLMWAQLGDLNLILNALRTAQRLLGFSLTMMSLAFLAGVNVVVTEIEWLADVIFFMGIVSLATLLALFVPLFLPYTSNWLVARYISYYPFKLLMVASES